jgi:16S rRNA (guanine527-N7)-methyltransferase
VAPLDRLLEIFAKPMKQGAKLLLYKGPEVENELAAVKKYRIKSELLSRYDLPDGMGTRVLLAIETLAR